MTDATKHDDEAWARLAVALGVRLDAIAASLSTQDRKATRADALHFVATRVLAGLQRRATVTPLLSGPEELT